MKSQLFSETGFQSEPFFKRSFLILIFLNQIFLNSFSQNQNNWFSRSGDHLEYHWECDALGQAHFLSMDWDWHGYDLYERQYSRLNHSLSANPYYKFVLCDPSYRLTYDVASRLVQIAGEQNLPAIYVIISFVQSLKYNVVNKLYYRYAIETLIDGQGMCADKSFLMAGLLRRAGYDVVLLEFISQQHMAIGVARRYGEPQLYGTYYTWYNNYYFYVETAGPLGIGVVPDPKYNQATIVNTNF